MLTIFCIISFTCLMTTIYIAIKAAEQQGYQRAWTDMLNIRTRAHNEIQKELKSE